MEIITPLNTLAVAAQDAAIVSE